MASGIIPYAKTPLFRNRGGYAETVPFSEPLTEDNLARYRKEQGGLPRIVVAGDGIFGLGSTQAEADHALAEARKTSRLVVLAEAFGGIRVPV